MKVPSTSASSRQTVAAFLPKKLTQRIPELVEFCGAGSISQLVRELVAQAIETMDAAKQKEVLSLRQQNSKVQVR
jgi:hypothetical protein